MLCRLLAAVAVASTGHAHEGPPYPICVDEVIGPVTVSIWADPDVGEGTFYYYLDPATSDLQIEAHAVLDGEPALETRGLSARPEARAPYQRISTLAFEQRGSWTTQFTLMDGAATLGEIELDIDVTPPGLGKLSLLWYAIPFLAAAAIWLRIFLAPRALKHEAEPALLP